MLSQAHTLIAIAEKRSSRRMYTVFMISRFESNLKAPRDSIRMTLDVVEEFSLAAWFVPSAAKRLCIPHNPFAVPKGVYWCVEESIKRGPKHPSTRTGGDRGVGRREDERK
jgi:hypothetical protein